MDPTVSFSLGSRFGRSFSVTAGDPAGGTLLLGRGTASAEAVFVHVAYDLVASVRRSQPSVSLLALGVDRSLLGTFADAACREALPGPGAGYGARHWMLEADPAGVSWNPLDAPWLGCGALARLLVDLAEDPVPFTPEQRSLAVDYLATVIAAYRLLPQPWFTFRDLSRAFTHLHGADVVDRANADVFGEYRYAIEIGPGAVFAGLRSSPASLPAPEDPSFPEALCEVVITHADVVASARPGLSGDPPVFPDHTVREGGEPLTYRYMWRRTPDGNFRTVTGADGFRALLWLLLGHHAAVRAYDTPVRRSLPMIPFGTELLAEPSDDRLAEFFRVFAAYDDLFALHPRSLRDQVRNRVRAFFRRFAELPLGRLLSPPAPHRVLPAERARRLPPLPVLRERGAVVVSAYAASGADPETARLLDVLLKRLWLSVPPDVSVETPDLPSRASVVFAPRYDRALLSGAADVAADAAAFLEGPGASGIVPVVGVPSLAVLDRVAGGRSWLSLLGPALRTRVVLAPCTGSCLGRVVRLLSPAASLYRRDFLSRRLARLRPRTALVSYAGSGSVFGVRMPLRRACRPGHPVPSSVRTWREAVVARSTALLDFVSGLGPLRVPPR